MIPGLSGRLVSHAYLEQRLLPGLGFGGLTGDLERTLGRWWKLCSRTLGPASSARQVFDLATAPLLELLGYSRPAMRPHGDLLFGPTQCAGGAVALVLALPWSAPIDQRWREGLRGGLASDAEWAIVTNGRSLRLIDCHRPWSKRSLQFDFDSLFADPRGVDVLRILAGVEAVGAANGPATLRAQIEASDLYAAGVCRSLGDGVLTALPRLASALAPGRTRGGKNDPYDQALTVIYRVLFLLFAEARGLVPVWHPVYREAYTIDALYRRAVAGRAPRGLWSALQATARMAHAGCRAGDLDVTAFNGRLFSPRHAPLVEQRRVPEEVVRAVVLALATTESSTGRQRIAYHDLGVEQLGAVYERVLEHEPVQTRTGAVLRPTSTRRKATGSFYTPRSITEFLIRRTLHPLVADRPARDILALRVVDPAMGSGAFLVAACHYLADQCERAFVRDGQWQASEITPGDRATLRRQVAERCLYGVDLNPTAVQLARLSLWLTTMATGKPLTFLDHHLAVGNSLLGARLADLSRPPLAHRPGPPAALPLFDGEDAVSIARQVLPERIRLALEPSDSLQVVRDKERTLERLAAPDGPFARWSRALDAWCAAGLWPEAPPSRALVNEWITALLGGSPALPPGQLQRSLRRVNDIAAAHALCHWELVFPEVFFDRDGRNRSDGGFDAVLGNPPWDMLRADTGSTSDRATDRARAAPLRRFYRASGRYGAQGHGHANRYQLFLERAMQLTRPGGRFGLILPSGIATDHGSSGLRRQLFDRCALDTWLGLDNKDAIFPIHRSVRFVVMTATNSGHTDVLRFRNGLRDPRVLDRYPSDPRHDQPGTALQVSRSRLQSWDPDHLTVPELTSPLALAILTNVSDAVPPLSSVKGWQARFGRELNATDDRPHFIRRPDRPSPTLLPIIEGKHVSPFRVSVDDSTWAVPLDRARKLIAPASSFERERIAYRDVASATNRLTLIAGLLPAGTLSTHTVFVLKTSLSPDEQWCLLGLMNSLVANYLVRLHVTTHVTTALMARLPVPRPPNGSSAFREIGDLARRLSACGFEQDPGNYAHLNSTVAGLYSLSREHYAHIVGSFPLLPEPLRSACLGLGRS